MSSGREHPDSRACEAWRVELRRGLECLREGAFERAERYFARAGRLAPGQPEVAFALGRERLRAGRAREAEELLRAAWDGDRSLLSAGAALARCLGLELERAAEASAVLVEAEAIHGPRALIDVVRAELALEAGRLPDARAAVERAQAAGAGAGGLSEAEEEAVRAALARVENGEGIELARAGDLEASLFRFKRAADLDPDWSGPRVNLGAAFARLGRVARARAEYERALDLDPDNPAIHTNYGRLCLESGELDLAVALLRHAVVLSPADPDGWIDLAAALQAQGDSSSAEDCLRQAIELDPQSREACLRLADLLARSGRYLEAARLAKRAQSAEPPEQPSRDP